MRPSTVVTTDQTSVDIFRTTVSEAPAKIQNEEINTELHGVKWIPVKK